MKLSVITDEITQDFEHALDVMADYRVKYAELRGLWGTNIAELDAHQTTRAKKAMRERGVSVCCLATPFYKCDLNVDEAAVRGPMHLATARSRSDQMELLRRCCGLAHEFGTELIRVFTFWRKGDLTPEIEDQIVNAFDEPIKIAENEGVTLVLENEHACYIGTGAEAARILSELDSPRVRACWDPGNAFAAGEVPYPAGYMEVRPFVAHVHVKDGMVGPDGKIRFGVIGEGQVDYRGQFPALADDGFQGCISLESHFVPEGGTQEEGSRACLAALRRFIKD